MFLGATALQFTGGRDISASAGEDRTALWGQGFAQLKEHPLFGVGFGQLGNYTEGNLTAHNTIVVCAAELGLFGLYFWSMFIFATLKDSITISTSQSKSQGVSSLAVDELYPSEEPKLEDTDDAEIRRLGNLVLLSITGFLTAGLFLSRAYVLTLYLLGGIAEVVFAMALQRGLVASRMPLARVMLYAAGLAALLVALMYVMIRVLNAVH